MELCSKQKKCEIITTTKEKQQADEICLGQEIQGMDIEPVEICALVWWVQIWVFVWCKKGERSLHAWFPLWSMEEVWRCFAGDTVGDLFKTEGTLNQHGYHSILQRHAIPSSLH